MSRSLAEQPTGGHTKWWVVGGGLALVAVVAVAYVFWPESGPTSQVAASQLPTVPRARTIPNVLEDGVKQDIGASSSTVITFTSVRVDDGSVFNYPAGTKVVHLRLGAQERVLDLLERANALGAKSFRRAFQASPDVTAVFIDIVGPVADRYGHRFNAPWISYVMGRHTFAKIDWAGFDGGSLCEFLRHEQRYDPEAETFCATKGEL